MAGRFVKPTRIGLIGAAAAIVLTTFCGAVLIPANPSSAQGAGSGPMSRPGSGPVWGGRDLWMPGWMHRRMWQRNPGDRPWRGNMSARMQRHWTYMHEGVPKAYAGLRSTLQPSNANIRTGGQLYTTHCASCHGKTGMGDGEAGKSLSPSPALLAFMIQRPVAVDEFLLWSIAEGGAKFATSMPAYKDVLNRDEIWKIVAYMRAGFPAVKAAGKKK